jgi:predicted NUDIX family NTP pyrophosphohydrolase
MVDPQGLIAAGEDSLTAAKREFTEETGHRPLGEPVPLGEAKQPGGKIVHVWAVEDDWDPNNIDSNLFEMEWPPKSRASRSSIAPNGWIMLRHAKDSKGSG